MVSPLAISTAWRWPWSVASLTASLTDVAIALPKPSCAVATPIDCKANTTVAEAKPNLDIARPISRIMMTPKNS